MEYINDWNDLRKHGVIMLTGESCNMGGRLLCDLTPAGVALMQEFLGGQVQFTQGSNWNSRDGQTASIMLAYEQFAPLAAYVLLYRMGYDVAVLWKSGTVTGFRQEEFQDRENGYAMAHDKQRIWSKSSHPGSGGRNQHFWSGRTK